MPAKHIDMQAAMKTHLSQSTGTGAFDGQHGMSLPAISSADHFGRRHLIRHRLHRGACEDVAAITGRETGASARPAIIKIASNRRMAR